MLSNYTPSGGSVAVDVSENAQEQVIISVTDTGLGIPRPIFPYL